MPQKPKKKSTPVNQTAAVTIQNAETKMANFIKFYKGINIVPEEEWKHFFESMLTDLPFSFRICENHRKFNNIHEGKPGTSSQAEVLRDFMKSKIFPSIQDVTFDDKKVEITPFPWYPKQLGWQCNFDQKVMNSTPELAPIWNFLFTEEKQTFIFKQEVASMVPPLLVDIQPHHKVLEMCCAPGFQTAQIVEAMHVNPKKPPEGVLVCNDLEMNRINYRWSQGYNTFFTHEDAKKYPDMYTTEDHDPDSILLYDRIFLDAQTSNDGTFRKNHHARGNWSVSKSQKCHKDLVAMLRRGLELLEFNGKLVYCTQSLNPIENEAVVAALLKEAPETLELVDVTNKLPDFHVRPGMSTWKVMSQGLVFYDTFESCPVWFKKENSESMFPPSEEDAATFNLDRCIRVMPHDNDTGAFFCAVITKLGDLPWQKEAEEKTNGKTEAMETDGKAEGEAAEAKKSEESGEKKAIAYNKPVKVDINVCVSQIEWTTECTDESLETEIDQEINSYDLAPMRISKTCIPIDVQRKLEVDSIKFEEVDPTNEDWLYIKSLFDIKRFDGSQNMLRLVEGFKNYTCYFYVNPALKNLVRCNKEHVKKSKAHTCGLLMMKCQDTGSKELTQFGHLPLLPYMNKRLIHVTKNDMLTILGEKAVLNKHLSDKVQRDLVAIEEKGPVYFLYEPKGKNPDPKCAILQRRESFKNYVKEVQNVKGENFHALRMCGVDPVAKPEDDDKEDVME